MRRGYGKIRIFYEKDLGDHLDHQKSIVINSIENESDDYLLNVNEDDYVKYKSAEAHVEPLKIHEDQVYASSSEQMIPAEYFPPSFFCHVC